jgi:hypothetical protein
VDLTYFIGRPFASLEEGDDGEWSIVLDGNARITNKDSGVELPVLEELQGTQFLRPIFSQTETRLQFGVIDNIVCEVALTPTQYTISDPSIVTEGDVYPQVPVELADSVPPDPSDERVADGPEPEQEEGDDENAA